MTVRTLLALLIPLLLAPLPSCGPQRDFDHIRFQRELVLASQDLHDFGELVAPDDPELAARVETLSTVTFNASIEVQQAIDSGQTDLRDLALATIDSLLQEADAVLFALGADQEELRNYVFGARVLMRRARARL